MGESLRREVLRIFKQLHRRRLKTFLGDERVLQAAREKINEEYRKYKNVTNIEAIKELNRFAEEVEHEIRTTVIQAVETEPGKLTLNITPDIALWENVPYVDSKCQQQTKVSSTESTILNKNKK